MRNIRRILAMVCVLGLVVYGCVLNLSYHQHAQLELLKITESLEIGGSEPKLNERESLASGTLRQQIRVLEASPKIVAVMVQTPLKFGASNWILVVLCKNGTIGGWGIRTEDSDHLRPQGSPEDVVASEVKKLWDREFGLQM